MKNENKKRSKLGGVLKIIAFVLILIMTLPIVILIIIKGINALRFNIGKDGVQESKYIKLGGYEQYVKIRGNKKDNPVLIFLHGGPGSPDGFLSYTYQPQLEDEYTCISWDQRGCGRTFYKSPNAPISLENMLVDLDDLVNYATNNFSKDIFIVGHSWGSLLGIEYAAKYPDKIDGYIGVGQFTDSIESGRLQGVAAAAAARSAGNEEEALRIEELAETIIDFSDNSFDSKQYLELSTFGSRYLNPNEKSPILAALCSPDLWWNDLRYQMIIMFNISEYFEMQAHITKNTFSQFKPPGKLTVPAAFIGGDKDYICSTVLAKEYANKIGKPFYEMKDFGHLPMFDNPDEFVKTLKEALNNLK